MLLLLLPVALLLPLIAAACGDEADSSEQNNSQEQVLQLADRIRRDEMIFATTTIADLPIHELDTDAQNGTIDGAYLPTARTVVRLTALTDWSSELEDQAHNMRADAQALIDALDSGADVKTIKPLSQALHEDWHMFPEAAWGHLAQGIGEPTAHDHEEGASETPGADHGASETPMSHD